MPYMPNKIITYTSRNNNTVLYKMVNSMWIAIEKKSNFLYVQINTFSASVQKLN